MVSSRYEWSENLSVRFFPNSVGSPTWGVRKSAVDFLFHINANGNEQADSLIDPAIKNDTKVYPSPEMMGKLFALEAMPLNIDRVRTRVWNKIRTGS
jgi:hypothetical protein